MTVRILTDSTCDLPGTVISSLGITVMPIYIHVGNRDYLDGIDISREEFYNNLPGYSDHPSTAVPSPAKFRSLYESLADMGATEILSIHISKTLSAMVDVAREAAKDIKSTRVSIFDSQQLSLGTGFLVKKAAELAKQGLNVKEILPKLDDQIRRTYVSAMLSTLKYLRRSGRMNGFISTIGELIQIKPILSMHKGSTEVVRVRTQQKGITQLIERIKSLGSFEKIAILHSGAIDTAHFLKEEILHSLPDLDVWVELINPVLGAHIGPGAVGFACVTSE